MSVHLPLRLVVGAGALESQQEEVDSGTAAALKKAFARASAELAERYGAYLSTSLLEPSFAWSGPAVGQVPQGLRRQTERRLRRLIPAAASAAGLSTPLDAIQPLSEEPREPFDPSRSLAFGRYLLDSYDKSQVPVGLDTGPHKPPPPGRAWMLYDVTDFTPHSDFLETAVFETRRIGLSNVATCGLLVHNASNPGWTLIMTTDAFGPKTKAINFGPQYFHGFIGLDAKGKPVFGKELLIPTVYVAGTATEARIEGQGDERSANIEAIMGPRIRSSITDRLNAQKTEEQFLLTEAELKERVEEIYQEQIKNEVAQVKQSQSLLRIDWGNYAFNIGLPCPLGDFIGWDGSPAPVVPATVESNAPAKLDLGTGGQGGGSARKGKGESGKTEGRGSSYGTFGESTGTGSSNKIFPSFGEGEAFVCEKFLGAEAELDALTEGRRLKALIAEIAERIDMPVCGYAATFCIGAAHTLAARAAAVGKLSGYLGPGELTLPSSAQPGNVGHATFRPTASRGIQLLRRLSQAAGKIAELRTLIDEAYINGSGRHALSGEYANNPVGWVRRFHEDVAPELDQGVGEIFAQTCQLVMLQLLDTSAQQIAARKANIKAYAPLFRDVMVRRLSDIGKLTAMRDRLREYETAKAVQAGLGNPLIAGAAAATMPGWTMAAKSLADSCVATEGFSHSAGAAHEIVEEDGVTKIRDENGFLWTKEALESEIFNEKGQAESIDPLIQQLSDIPENVEKFRQHPEAVEPFLSDLLDEMAGHNRDKRWEAMFDWRFGIRTGKISEDVQGLVVEGVELQLAGVHQIAHEQIYPFFGSHTKTYASGLNYVFGVELGIQAFEHFAVFTGMILLAVICAPAAFVAGVASAAYEVHKANERMNLYKALINPELVLNRAEIEMERYVAYVGLALSLLPEAGTAVKAASVGFRGAAKKGIGVGLRLAGRAVVKQVSRQVTEQLAKEMLPALLHEIATNLLMEQVVVPYVVGPVIAKIQHELELTTSVGGMDGAEKLIAQLEAEAEQATQAPLPAGLDTAGAE